MPTEISFEKIHGQMVGVVHVIFPENEEMTQFYYKDGFVDNTLEYSILDDDKSKELFAIVSKIESVGKIEKIDVGRFVEGNFLSDVNVENVYEIGQYPSIHIIFRGSECDVSDDVKNTVGYKALEKAIVLLCEDKSSRIFEYPDDIED